MQVLAAALLLCVVLYLVDKNRQWKRFWYAVLTMIVLAGIFVGGVAVYDHHTANAAAPPDFIPDSR